MIWLIGGTSNSREASEILKKNKKDHIVTVATEYGEKLYSNVEVRVGRMDLPTMRDFVEENKIKTIVDASHPYAIEVTKASIKIANDKNINHIRYEREILDYKYGIKFKSYEDVSDYLKSRKGNVLVTTGSNNLEAFCGDSRYYIRVLPVELSIKKAITMGISPKNIIGLQGPFNVDFNRALIKNYNIKYLLTKESGSEGGEKEKIDACIKEGIELLVIKRPQINYKDIVYKADHIINRV